jgi:hypothetical protein
MNLSLIAKSVGINLDNVDNVGEELFGLTDLFFQFIDVSEYQAELKKFNTFLMPVNLYNGASDKTLNDDAIKFKDYTNIVKFINWKNKQLNKSGGVTNYEYMYNSANMYDSGEDYEKRLSKMKYSPIRGLKHISSQQPSSQQPSSQQPSSQQPSSQQPSSQQPSSQQPSSQQNSHILVKTLAIMFGYLIAIGLFYKVINSTITFILHHRTTFNKYKRVHALGIPGDDGNITPVMNKKQYGKHVILRKYINFNGAIQNFARKFMDYKQDVFLKNEKQLDESDSEVDELEDSQFKLIENFKTAVFKKAEKVMEYLSNTFFPEGGAIGGEIATIGLVATSNPNIWLILLSVIISICLILLIYLIYKVIEKHPKKCYSPKLIYI